MFQSNVKESFILGDKIITDTLFGLQLVPDNSVITEGSVAVGYDCHAPPEPAVKKLILSTSSQTLHQHSIREIHHSK